MDVTIRLVRQLEINDMRHIVDIDTPRRDISRDQNPDLALAEILQCPLAGILRLVAMDGLSRNAGFTNFFRNTVGAMLCAGKDNNPGKLRVFQQLHQKRRLVSGRNMIDRLGDQFDRRRRRRYFDSRRPVQNFFSQLGDIARHRRRKQQRLGRFARPWR